MTKFFIDLMRVKKIAPLLAIALMFTTFSCNDDDDVVPAADVSISITPNVQLLQPGTTVTFSVSVDAGVDDVISASYNDGSGEVAIPNAIVGTFDVDYTYPATATAGLNITFSASNGTNAGTATAIVTYVKPATLLADFSSVEDFSSAGLGFPVGDQWGDFDYSGALYGSADKTQLFSRGGFAVDVANGGFWDFDGGDNVPGSPEDPTIMMSREALSDGAGGTQWGGYMIPVFKKESGVYDPTEIAATQDGSRVYAVDVYFEELDDTHTFAEISGWRTDHMDNEGAVKDKNGIKLQLRSLNWENWRIGPDGMGSSGDENAVAQIMEAYLTEANTWTTIYFTTPDVGEQGVAKTEALDNVDAIWFQVNYAYPNATTNKFYLKNLRITTEDF